MEINIENTADFEKNRRRVINGSVELNTSCSVGSPPFEGDWKSLLELAHRIRTLVERNQDKSSDK